MRLTLAIALIPAVLGAVDYSGYQVLRILPSSEAHVNFLRELTDSVEYDVWREPRKTGVPVDLMCHQHEGLLSCSSLTALLMKAGIDFHVMVKDVENLSNSVMGSIDVLKREEKKAGSGFDVRVYQTYNDTTAWVKSLPATYPGVCELLTVGMSYEGREIVGIRVTGSKGTDSTKPGFWMDGGLHAREWITTATVSWMLDQTLSLYASGDAPTVAMVDTLDLVFVPILNPDGYEWTWTDDRLFRKTRMPNDKSPCVGTDPNRNWAFHWGEAGQSSVKCSDSYSGASAANQPEIAQTQDYIRNDGRFKGYINFHSYSQLWMSPWGYTSDLPPDFELQDAGSQAAVAALEAVHGTQYEYGPISTTIYPASGSSADYTYGVCNLTFSYGVELRDTGEYGFLLPPDQIVPSGEETWAGVTALAQVIINNL